MIKEYIIIRLYKMANQAVDKFGQTASQLANKNSEKEEILAELNFQRDMYDTCRLCLTE